MRWAAVIAAATAGVALLIPVRAARAQSFSLLNPASGTAFVAVNPGQTFTLTVFLNAPSTSTTGVTYFLDTPDGGSGLFQIVDRSNAGSPFTELTTDNATVLAPANALLDPRNNNDLGATVADVLTPNVPGSYLISTLTLRALGSVPAGLFTLRTSPNSLVTDENFSDVTTAPGTFQVTVNAAAAPEPATGVLVAMGILPLGGALLRRHRRSR